MVTEIAQIEVKPGTEKDFEAGVAKAKPLFLRAKGCSGMELQKSVEKPTRYRLLAERDIRFHHLHESVMQKVMATAARAVGATQHATPPTFR